MARMKAWSVLGIALIVASALLVPGQGHTQVEKGKTRVLTTHDLMEGLVQPQCASLGKLLKSDSPNWKKARVNAALLNEASYILMADGRCPDGVWKEACETLRTGSAEVLAAVADKNAEEAQKAFGAMTKSCATCHKAHKKKD